MTESAIRSNESEATRLFERGVAAARGGQRLVAAGLLGRAVQLNPRHELGWLWLAGVLDDPQEIAFCLRSVLAINPNNDRARQGLLWLEQRSQIVPQPAPLVLPEAQPTPLARQAAADEHHDRHERESWWVGWRHSRRELGRARLLVWSAPIILLLLTLGLNAVLRDAVERNQALAREAAQPRAVVVRAPAPPAIIQAELPPMREAQALAYLSALARPREQLRAAITSYRAATGQPGGSSIAHAAAARALREQIDQNYTRLEALDPPASLAQAHNRYLAGLEIERQAVDDMLEFYSNLSLQSANRATLRMVDSSRQLDRARALFDALQGAGGAALMPAQVAR